MWPTPTPYPMTEMDLPELNIDTETNAQLAESLVQGYNTLTAQPFIATIGYMLVMIVFVMCAWTLIQHWKQIDA